MVITFHINPHQKHQVEHAEWFAAGLQKHGLKLNITTDPAAHRITSDIHIVSGPHYAKKYWVGHPNTILIDRAYWHDGDSKIYHSMDWVSVGWMNEHGGRDFVAGTGRQAPNVGDNLGKGAIFLVDYNGKAPTTSDILSNDIKTVRFHPANVPEPEPLLRALSRHDTAIGNGSTALVKAALCGLQVKCRDPHHLLADPNWLSLLPYADWHYSDFQSGELWEHLQSSRNQPTSR